MSLEEGTLGVAEEDAEEDAVTLDVTDNVGFFVPVTESVFVGLMEEVFFGLGPLGVAEVVVEDEGV